MAQYTSKTPNHYSKIFKRIGSTKQDTKFQEKKATQTCLDANLQRKPPWLNNSQIGSNNKIVNPYIILPKALYHISL